MKSIVAAGFLSSIFKNSEPFKTLTSIKHVRFFSSGFKCSDSTQQQIQHENYRQRRSYSFIHDTNYLCLGDNLRTDEVLFEMFKNEETGLLPIGKFLNALRATGLRKTDPRLKEMVDILKMMSKGTTDGYSIDTQKLNLNDFKRYGSNEISSLVQSRLPAITHSDHTLITTDSVRNYLRNIGLPLFFRWKVIFNDFLTGI
ncbi:hypothetical protein D910_01969 [Dendroctonus ponderosae]